MGSRTITSLSILGCGSLLLIVGALVGNESLQTVGTTVLLTGVAYATGKAIASRQEHKP
jgi:hypothetical protein